MNCRSVLACIFSWVACGPLAAAGEVAFTPLAMPQGNTESRTGMWFCPDLGRAPDILPLKTRVWATRTSVTGGVALKGVFEKGSRGVLAYEVGALPAGSAGLTLYAKASRKLTLKVANVPAEVGTDWREEVITSRRPPRWR